MAGRRMSYADRHAQLLDTAAKIVRTEGADALTLARVAEEAGVSKPVAYEHFERRSSLLAMLYARMDDQQAEAARAALDSRATTLEEAVRFAAEAYVDCTLGTGREFGAVTAALGSIAGAEDRVRGGRERYAGRDRCRRGARAGGRLRTAGPGNGRPGYQPHHARYPARLRAAPPGVPAPLPRSGSVGSERCT
jgi:AcrR family transcriptional regulator